MARRDPQDTGHATRSVDRVSGRQNFGWARLKASLHRTAWLDFGTEASKPRRSMVCDC